MNSKRKKNELSLIQKQEICRYHQENPKMTQLSLIRFFSDKFGHVLAPSTLRHQSIKFNNRIRLNTSMAFLEKFRHRPIRAADYVDIENSEPTGKHWSS